MCVREGHFLFFSCSRLLYEKCILRKSEVKKDKISFPLRALLIKNFVGTLQFVPYRKLHVI